MGWFHILIGIIAAITLFKSGHLILAAIAIVSAIGCFCSYGIMHNYAVEHAKMFRLDYKGGFYDFTNGDVDAVPDRIAKINFVFSMICFILLIVGIVFLLITF